MRSSAAPGLRGVFIGLMSAVLLAALDQTIVVTALPAIAGEFGRLSQLSWVVTAYLFAVAVSVPLYGKLADLFGRKRLFQGAIGLFIVASIGCGTAMSMSQLVGFRVLQGIGGGGLTTLAQIIMADVVSPRERGRYMGYIGAVWAFASVAGPLVGGFLVDSFNWRLIFLLNIPVGIVALIVVQRNLAVVRLQRRRQVDIAGATLLTTAVLCVLLVTVWGGSVHPWMSPIILSLSVVAVGSLALFIRVERTVAEPILPLDLFAQRIFVDAAALGVLSSILMFGSIVYLPVFLQLVGGASATASGIQLVPLILGIVVGNVGSGNLITRTGRYRVFPIVGSAMLVGAWTMLATIGVGTSVEFVSLVMVLIGLGVGMTMQVVVLAVQNGVAARDLGVATSTVQFCRQLGATIGVATLGAVLAVRVEAMASPALEMAGVDSFDELMGGTTAIRDLAPELQLALREAVATGLNRVFVIGIPVAVAALFFSIRMREVPLRTTSGADELGTQ